MRKRFSSVALVLLVLSSMSVCIQPVAASSGQSVASCSDWDEFWWVLSVGTVNGKCDPSEMSQQIQDLQASENNKTELDLYEGVYATKTQQDVVLTMSNNTLQDARTVAYAKAQAAAVNATEAGKFQVTAQSDARAAVNDYYSHLERNLLASWNTEANAFYYAYNSSENDSGLSQNYWDKAVYNMKQSGDLQSSDPVSIVRENASVSLSNSSTVTVTLISSTYNHGIDEYYHFAPTPAGVEDGTSYYKYNTSDSSLIALGVSSNPNFTAVDMDSYHARWTAIENQSQMVKANIDQYVAAVYDAKAAGQFNASEWVTPLVSAQEYSTDYNSTGYYAYAVASLSSIGYQTPALNGTGLMTVSYDNITYHGIVMSQNAPDNGTWQTNVTYDTSAIPGVQYLVTESGDRVEMNGTFSIDHMENKDGQTINQTSVQRYYYATANASAFADVVDQLTQLRAEINSREPTGTGGSGSGSPIDQKTLLLLAAVAGVAIVATQRGD